MELDSIYGVSLVESIATIEYLNMNFENKE